MAFVRRVQSYRLTEPLSNQNFNLTFFRSSAKLTFARTRPSLYAAEHLHQITMAHD